MKRRGFIQTVIMALTALFSPFSLPVQTKECQITLALRTPQGRAMLAQSMVMPLRRQLNYQAIGRKLCMVEELPQGAYAYSRDRTEVARVTNG